MVACMSPPQLVWTLETRVPPPSRIHFVPCICSPLPRLFANQVEMAGVYSIQERAAVFLEQLSSRSLPLMNVLSGQARLFAAVDVLVQVPGVVALREAFQSLNTNVLGRFNSFHAVLKR